MARNKRDGESFSEEIRRVFGKKRNFYEFAGAWKNVSKADIKRIKKGIEKFRKSFSKSAEERTGELS